MIGEDGEQLGIMSLAEARRLADEKNLDLVKISPQAIPPVCKLMNYGKYKYEMVKKAKEAKKNQKIVELKEVWLSATIDIGDLKTKATHANRFLCDGDKVRVSIRLKGRQMAHPEVAIKVMENFFELVKENGTMEKKPIQEARTIAMILSPTIKK